MWSNSRRETRWNGSMKTRACTFQTAAPTALIGQADKSEVTPQAPPCAIRRLFYMGNFAFMGELSTEPEPRASWWGGGACGCQMTDRMSSPEHLSYTSVGGADYLTEAELHCSKNLMHGCTHRHRPPPPKPKKKEKGETVKQVSFCRIL